MKSIVNIGKLLVSIACVGALTTSCNSDFLDRPPLGTLDEVTYLSTKDAGYKLLVNCYQPYRIAGTIRHEICLGRSIERRLLQRRL